MSGSKIEALINICCEIMADYRSKFQGSTAQQEDHLGDVFLEK